MKLKFIKLVCLLFVLSFQMVFSQGSLNSCPPNFDLEMGSFANWQSGIGTVATGPIYFITPQAGPVITRQSITPTGYSGNLGLDPYGSFPVVCPAPNGGTYSAKLGNDFSGSECERLIYQLHVPPTNHDFSFTFNYAVVLENPLTHTPFEQPRFEVKVYDSITQQVIPCATFSFVSGSNMPGFLLSPLSVSGAPIYYKPWTAHSMSIHNMQGKTVTVEFTTNDCTQGAHFGYAYIDFNSFCDSTKVFGGYCIGVDSGALIAPLGFQNYQWYDTNFVLLDTGQTIFINSTFPANYYLVVNPYAGFGCADTILQLVTFMPKPIANFSYPNHYCANSVVQFNDLSYSTSPGTFISAWNWNFNDPNATAGPPNGSTSFLQNPTHVFTQPGTYQIILEVFNSAGCISDTVMQTIIIDQPAVLLPITASNDSLCTGDTITVSFNGLPQFNYLYQWQIPTGTSLIAGNLNSYLPISFIVNTAGNFTIGFSAQPPVGDTTCWANAFLPIHVNATPPFFFISGLDSICPGTVVTLNVSNSPPNCGPSTSNCNGNYIYDLGFATSPSLAVDPSPFQGGTTEGRSQSLFLQNEIIGSGFAVGGVLSHIGWEILSKNSSQPYQNFTIKLACVPYNSLPLNSFDTTSALTTVYSNINYTSVLGLNLFSLNVPYNWDGVSNLLVDVSFDNGANSFSGTDKVKKSKTPIGSRLNNWVGTNNNTIMATMPSYPSGVTILIDTLRPDFVFKGCTGNISSNNIYNWTSTPAGLSLTTNGNVATLYPTVTTTYTATTNNAGCTASQNFTVTVNNTLTVNAGNDSTICGGGSVNLMANANIISGVNFNWTANPVTTINNANQHNANATPVVPTQFVVTANGNGYCTVVDTILVIPVNSIHLNVSNDTSICTGSSIALSATADSTCTTCFVWQVNGPAILSCTNCNNPIVTINGNATIIVTATSSLGCSQTDTIHLSAIVLPTATFTLTDSLCKGATTLVTYTGNAPVTANYNWNFNGAIANPTTMGQGPYNLIWNSTGTQTVSLTLSYLGCTNNFSQNVLILPIPVANITLRNTEICVGQSVLITATGSTIPTNASVNFQFNGGLPASSTTPQNNIVVYNQAGLQLVTLQISNNGCGSIIDSAYINVLPLPIANAGPNQTIFPGNSAILNGATSIGGTTYIWSPALYLNVFSVANPIATPPSTTSFILNYINNVTGCSDLDTMVVFVNDCRELIIPNTFSPNRDGKNDFFNFVNPEDFEALISFEIFNRWGQRVFSTTELNGPGWDGNFQGEEQPSGSYVYSIVTQCGISNKSSRKGDVTLIR
jgi:gliding motility-associated-like protein